MATLIKLETIKDIPWKNGGGVTKELFYIPHPENPSQFIFRLSIASVKDSGPFSVFTGIDRILLLLKGSGLILKKGNEEKIHLNKNLEPLSFPGEESIHSELISGPVTDFNVMTDRGHGHSEISVRHFQAGEKNNFLGYPQKFLYEIENESLWILEERENFQVMRDMPTTFIEVTFYRHHIS